MLQFVIIESLILRPVYITGKRFCFPPPPPGHLVMSGDIFGYHNLGDVSDTGIEQVETRDAAQHPIIHRTALHNREVSGPKYQWR